jgi:hypothetical protein
MHAWATLTAVEQRAASILGYTAATWNAELEQGDAELEQGDAQLEQGDAELDQGDAELDQGDNAPDGALRATDEADADGANDETFGAGAVDATPATTLPTPLGMALPALLSAAVSRLSHSHSHSHSQLPPFASHTPPAAAPLAIAALPHHLRQLAKWSAVPVEALGGAVAAAPSRTVEIPSRTTEIPSWTAEIPSRSADIPSRTAVIPSILIDCSSVAAADNPLEMGFLNLNAVRQAQMELLIAC